MPSPRPPRELVAAASISLLPASGPAKEPLWTTWALLNGACRLHAVCKPHPLLWNRRLPSGLPSLLRTHVGCFTGLKDRGALLPPPLPLRGLPSLAYGPFQEVCQISRFCWVAGWCWVQQLFCAAVFLLAALNLIVLIGGPCSLASGGQGKTVSQASAHWAELPLHAHEHAHEKWQAVFL